MEMDYLCTYESFQVGHPDNLHLVSISVRCSFEVIRFLVSTVRNK